jgi:hypothetical protein
LFACFSVAELAEAYGVFAWFRHEPGCFGDGFCLLAPGTFDLFF